METAAVKSMLAWYREHQRVLPWRSLPTPYRVLVSEVMLQQTQVATVMPYFERFVQTFPDFAALAAADIEAVLKLWEGLGYYSRARRLHACAQLVMENGGELSDDPTELARLPGIGPYTAAAIASIAFGRPYPAVDGNVLRVQARLLADDGDVSSQSARRRVYERLLAVIQQTPDPSAFNQAQMDLGAMVCLPRQPLCDECPLRVFCRAFASGEPTVYPRRPERRVTPRMHVAVGLIFYRGRLLILRRSEDQMLGGLWEFPGGKLESGETPSQAVEREVREETGLTVEIGALVGVIQHAYSHFRITMHAYRCRLAEIGEPVVACERLHAWVIAEDLPKYAFPKANHKIFACEGFAEGFQE
ncbi:MAG: A/G-specific adenine glycosylase [Lentisphaerae bacterium]|nr:A/G-specific adenine glycosylase [Lentisphaerota bacterium]